MHRGSAGSRKIQCHLTMEEINICECFLFDRVYYGNRNHVKEIMR